MKKIYHVLEDPVYREVVLDREEERTRSLPDGTAVPYHYVHAHCAGTALKFILCLPKKENYGGHFLQYLSPFPGPDEEDASMGLTGEKDRILFALVHGYYEVESNMASASAFGSREDDTVVWKTSAAAAEYGRQIAMRYYGTDKRPYGYVYGGSGGGYKTMACIENTDAWDGAAPYVIGSPASLPNTICMHVQGERLLRGAFETIVDALDAGGSADPMEGLTREQQEGLHELTQMGFPPRAWFLEAHGLFDAGALPVLLPGVKAKDPSYFTDFWTKPGYEGYSGILSTKRDRVLFDAKVVRIHVPDASGAKSAPRGENGVDDAWHKLLGSAEGCWVELDHVPVPEDGYTDGTQITFRDGDAAGRAPIQLAHFVGNCALIAPSFGVSEEDIRETLQMAAPGDLVHFDNSDYLAVQSYYRHQVPDDPAFHAWDEIRQEKIPQRDEVMGYSFTGTGTVQDGQIQGKVIVSQCLMDESTTPWCGDWYRQTVERAGNGAAFRLYYFDRALHGDTNGLETPYITNYLGQLYQILLDLTAWVEQGKEPLPATNYTYEKGQIQVPQSAKERRGMQPVVEMTGYTARNEKESSCVHAKVGEPITFTARAQVPDGAGAVTSLAFDFSEDPEADVNANATYFQVEGALQVMEGGAAQSRVTHCYETPGTHFAAVRVMSQRDGNPKDPFTRIRNLARVRVMVEEE